MRGAFLVAVLVGCGGPGPAEPPPVELPDAPDPAPPVALAPVEPPEVVAARAEIARLRAAATETQAKHMRAVADHKAGPCGEYSACMDSALAGERPGKARAMRACMRAKGDGCKLSEKTLEQARATNIAATAELQAARQRLKAVGTPDR